MPASWSSRAVPPVETISTPSSASPCAKSTRPRLSDALSSARRIVTSAGGVIAAGPPSVAATGPLLDDDLARRGWIDPHRSPSYQAHRPRQQAVLDLVDLS